MMVSENVAVLFNDEAAAQGSSWVGRATVAGTALIGGTKEPIKLFQPGIVGHLGATGLRLTQGADIDHSAFIGLHQFGKVRQLCTGQAAGQQQ